MNYKEALFFIGKCLTINYEEHNKTLIEETLKSNIVDWDTIVKISTGHFVFPALYCNLKKADFLNYLPTDLVEYMIHITNLNRERNEQIIIQAKELNEILLANNITPIFLKGTGNLLEGLYDDIAERMVGDIDFLVSEENYIRTANLLENDFYTKAKEEIKENLPDYRHYFRLKKEKKIAAIEIHRGLTNKKNHTYFNFKHVNKSLLSLNNITYLSYQNQLSLSIIAYQINNHGKYFNNIALRNAYDIFLISRKTNSIGAIKKTEKLFIPLNNFLAICKVTLNTNLILFERNSSTKKTLKKFHLNNDKNLSQKNKKRTLFIKKGLNILFTSLYNKKYRAWIMIRISNKNWQKEKFLKQLSLKKTKPNL